VDCNAIVQNQATMRRTAIAAAWVFGATVPLLASVVFVFGCCVLPFHRYIHKALPLCHLAVDFISGEQAAHQGASQPSMPARGKQEPVKRIATAIPRSLQLAALSEVRGTPSPVDRSAYRSFIALGALRCDQDVGLHLLTGTLLI
jgi:hypothetical protein